MQQDDELVAAQSCDLESVARVRRARDLVVSAEDLAETQRGPADQLVADDVAEHVVDATEVVEVHVQHGQCMPVVPGGGHRLVESLQEARAIRQAGQAVDFREFLDATVGVRALLAEREGHLADLVRMKRLLQVEELVGGRHATAEFRRIDVRVGGADDDLDLRIDLADALGGPRTVRPRGHAHVEERDGEGPSGGSRLAHGRHRSFGASAVHGLESRLRRRDRRHECRISARHEQSGAQLVENRAVRARRRRAQHLAIGVEDRLLVVDDEDSNG